MKLRCNQFLFRFTTYTVGGWVVGKLESNAKLNSKVEVEVEVGVELGKRQDLSRGMLS